jgi:ABC-type branched-subunit amino acid transport system permease subunit
VFGILVSLDQSLGGGTGISLVGLDVYAPGFRQAYTFWLTLACTTVLLGLVFFLLRRRIGTSLQAVRDDEEAAASLGVNVARSKRVLFIVAAVGCGIAGALSTLANTLFIQTNSVFGVQWTAYMLFMVLVGGLGTFEGPILGAITSSISSRRSSGTAEPGTSSGSGRSRSPLPSSCPTASGARSTAGCGCGCCPSVTHYDRRRRLRLPSLTLRLKRTDRERKASRERCQRT